jgi:hypothetical protein
MLDVKDKKTARDLIIWGVGIFFVGFIFWGAFFELVGVIVFIMGIGEYLFLDSEEKKSKVQM